MTSRYVNFLFYSIL